ncbi:glycoside hydrolase family 19 protein [Consotaella aegiceratis]|uniref:glycoside hydrolase family 19 protein n=1 Tax=Consotaella aegiceratis TaxID=3097961 RepID=UPI002F425E5C
MQITADTLAKIAGGTMTAARKANIASIIAGLEARGYALGLDQPQRLCHYISQTGHESGRFVYDKEVWGPTPAQKRYDTRTDLGNTAAADGDGKLYMGRTGIQITGKANTTAFRDWCRDQGLPAPDFVANPDLMNTDPWEGLGPIWYWSTRNLNRYADMVDGLEMITRKINGGTNGLDDRIALYARTALVLLGRKLEAGAVKTFQAESGLIADDIVGPATRKAFHAALVGLDDEEAVAPVVVTEPVAVPVVVPQSAPAVSADPADFIPALTLPEYLKLADHCITAARQLTEA